MLKKRIATMLTKLHSGLYEREEPLRLAFLSAIAGESTFLIGPPGVAKSLIARRLKYIFDGAKAFEYLMNRFSTPDEIFGPVSIQELKNDKYIRQTTHYLPGAEVVFLDEIWKAGPSIQNTLLTVLNEKVFRNGAQEEKLPLKALIAASNELPATGEGLEALWDRFLVRYQVTGIEADASFDTMIVHSASVMDDPLRSDGDKISDKDIKVWKQKISQVEVPTEVLLLIRMFRNAVQKYNEKHQENPIYISDRRWKKIIRLLRTSAFLNDRNAVDQVDLFLIPHCTWEVPEQFETLDKLLSGLVKKHGYSLSLELSGIDRAIKSLAEDVDEEIFVTTQKALEGYVVNTKGMIKVEGLEAQFQGKYISRNQIINMVGNNNWVNISIYDGNGIRKQEAQGRMQQNGGKIDIANLQFSRRHNEKTYSLPLLTGTEFNRLYKKPHDSTIKTWDKIAENIRTKIVAKRTEVETFRDKDLAKSKENLFAREDKFGLVTDNLVATLKRIKDQEVKLDSEIHRYQNVEGGKIDTWKEEA